MPCWKSRRGFLQQNQGLLTDPESVLQVIPTEETWFGMTYAEDREAVESAIQHKITQGIYPPNSGNNPSTSQSPLPWLCPPWTAAASCRFPTHSLLWV